MRNVEELHYEAPIVKKTADLYAEFYQCLKTFPKRDQYMLGKRCEEHLLSFFELVLRAAYLDTARKLSLLEDASGKLDILKALFRMARELKLLENKKYLSLEGKTQEIGKMLGGWMRSSR